MEEEDSDGSTGPTIEEIISSVMKRKSKLGMSWGNRLNSRPPSAVKSHIRKDSSSPESDEAAPKAKTLNLRTCLQRNSKPEAKTSSSISSILRENTSSETDTMASHRISGEALPNGLPEKEQLSLMSGLRMKRSCSTPEVKSKFLSSLSSTSEVEHRIAGHHQVCSTRDRVNQSHKGEISCKENKEPPETVPVRYQDVLPHSLKAACQIDIPHNGAPGPNSMEAILCLDSKIVGQNALEVSKFNSMDHPEITSISSKRNLLSECKNSIDNMPPSKIPNIACSPFKASNMPGKFSAKDTQVMQTQPECSAFTEGESMCNSSLDTAGASTAIALRGGHPEKSRDLQYVNLPKGCSNKNTPKEITATSQQADTDNGYVTGSTNCNTLSVNTAKMSTPAMQTPSVSRLRKMPPTPQTNQKLKKIDHIEVNGQQYLKLGVIGRGGSSKVYEVLDLETRKVKAIKIVELEGLDEATLKSYENEIEILKRLQWSDRIIKLFDFEHSEEYLKLVMEKANQDMASLLSSTRGNKQAPISPFTIKHYWHGMLLAVQAIHNEGIIHSDLKPANFVLVNQIVKLIDFGIASSVQQDMTSIVKDSQGGTFNYMSPESVLDVHTGPVVNKTVGDKVIIKISVKSDVWSLGCILYNLVYGRTPFQHITNPLRKLAAISNPDTEIQIKAIEDKQLEDVMKLCLQFNPRSRPSIHQLLQHPYLTDNQSSSSNNTTPLKSSQLKSAMDQLVQLTPNSLNKITMMMQNMKPDN